MTDLLRSMLDQKLGKREILLWSGQPDPLQSARTGLAAAVPGGMMIAMGVGWISVVVSHLGGGLLSGFPEQVLFLAVTGVFLGVGALIGLMGLGLLLVPVWLWRRARGTLYGVTSTRCVILVASWPKAADGYPHSRLVRVERVDHESGRGDVVVTIREETGAGFQWKGPVDLLRRVSLPGGGTGHRVAFRGIREASMVEGLLLELQKERGPVV